MQSIEEATILSETKSEKAPAGKTISAEINVDDKKQSGEQKVKIDFASGDYTDEILKQKTKRSDAPVDSAAKSESAESLRAKILEDEKQSQFTREDFETIAEFLIDLIDVGIGTALRLWAGDTIDTPYSITTDKKNKLRKSLTLILIKYQAKFPIEFIFIIGLAVAYIVPFRNAQKFRKEKKKYLEENPDGEYKIPEMRFKGNDMKEKFDRREYLKRYHQERKAKEQAEKETLESQKQEEKKQSMEEAAAGARLPSEKGQEQSDEQVVSRVVLRKKGPKPKPNLPVMSKRQGI